MRRSYLDHAATTPMLPEAVAAMTRELGRVGNASSLHGSGRDARRVVEESREAIAARLGAHPTEVVFTSGGTESDNLAVKGGYWSRAAEGRLRVLTTAVEHHAVLDAAGWLGERAGAEVGVLPVDGSGRLETEALRETLDRRTALVSVVWAGNEVGTLQPVAEVAERARRHGALAHSDAVQAVGHVPVDFRASGLDLLTFTAHKLGGPRGVGALLARREVTLTPLLHGGGQERDLRSGTVDVAGVAGFAAAVQVALARLESERHRLAELRDRLVTGVRRLVPDAVLNGDQDPAGQLPGLASLSFPGSQADAVVMLLDAAGVDCSAGAACSAGVTQPSHVLLAMGRTPDEARSAVRFSLGHTSTADDVDHLLRVLPEAVARARAAAAFA